MRTRSPSELAAAFRSLDESVSLFWLADIMPLPGMTAAGIRGRARCATRRAMAIQEAAKTANNREIEKQAAILIEQVAPYLSVTVINESYKEVVLGGGIWAADAHRSRE